FINYDKSTIISTELKDKNDITVPLDKVMLELTEYVKDKIDSKEDNVFRDQILPLMTQAVVLALPDLIGVEETALLLAKANGKYALIYSMATAFLLLKYMQKHNLSIETIEEEISQQEIQKIIKRIQINNAIIIAAEEGISKEQILQSLLSLGKVTEEDINDFNEYSKE
ncbi:MAG: hypothetical protein AABY22_15765, partial [Nanoarchaeota archaeon]